MDKSSDSVLAHTGRKGMKRGRNIFNPNYKPIGQIAGTDTQNPLQRQPVKNTKRKRLASMKAERAQFKTFKLTPEKYANAVTVAKTELNRNLNYKALTGKEARSKKAQDKERSKKVNKNISSVDNDNVKYEKNRNVLSKGSKKQVVSRDSGQYEPGIDSGNKKSGSLENPLKANANYNKSSMSYANKSAEASLKKQIEDRNRELAKNKGDDKINNPLYDRQTKVSQMRSDAAGAKALKERKEKEKIERSKKKKTIRSKAKRQSWQH